MSEYLRLHTEDTASKRTLNVAVIGPKECDEDDYVFRKLDWFSRNYDKVIIHDNCIPGKEYNRYPDKWSDFPLAALWAEKRFQTIVKHHAPGKGEKRWSKGVRLQIEEQLKSVDKVIAFRDFEDDKTETFIEIAKVFRVKVIEIRI